ncbi:hypothetical protein SAMN05216345_111155 [Cupriavidus sp. YR651]|uniref:hypothetical protein n=1 Tax=Cupriavidus sp. YR651 TaxID=1855315 RepID=UPI00088B74DD|nr:hypothetical protein [Cupriavidus sp. YR651]SDD58664.1 hypothetical protein SAMN05216345_111155 [Cupriavidus sp. YR651]
MYVASLGQRAETRTTLAGVLQLLNDDRDTKVPVRLEDISLRHIERGDIPVVRLPSGKLAVRPQGTARSILAQIIDEVDRFIVRVDGKVLRPHEMSRASWGAVLAAGRLGFFPEEAIDLAQGDAGPLFQTKDLFEESGPFDMADYVRSEFARRFGYGTNGPVYAPDQIPNARHEVHVAYALLRGDKLRECVLNTYRGNERYGQHDIEWLHTLIAVPSLRGALPHDHMKALCQVMRLEKLPITQHNASKLLAIGRRLPAEATMVHVDDALYAAGFLPPRSAPTTKAPAGEAARPVSALAERIHQLITERQFAETMQKATADREAMLITQRHFDDIGRRAAHTRASTGFDWPNRVALAVLQRDVASILRDFDSPKDWNTDSKRALRDVLDVDLLQCTAAVRRRRIFNMCGFSEDEQARWESNAAEEQAQARADREFAEVCVQAEKARIQIETGQIMSGREYVDFCIAAGFSQLIDQLRGSARRYWMHHPGRGASRPLRAKDGTLSYARARLARIDQPIALAA